MTIDQTPVPGGARDLSQAPRWGGRDPEPSASHAWQREMERAQISSWFQPPLMHQGDTHATESRPQPHAPDRAAGGAHAAEPATPRAADLQRLLVAAHPSHTPHLYPPAQAPYGMSALRVQVAAQTSVHRAPVPATPLPTLRASVLATVTQAIGTGADAETPSATPGIRVHIEASAHGAAVWVGVPAKEAISPPRLEAMLQALKRSLNQEGTELQSLTVNGRSIWSHPSNTPTLNPPEEP